MIGAWFRWKTPSSSPCSAPRIQQLEVGHPDLSGQGGVSARALVRLCLRLRPDHIVVGEVRDEAAWDMLDAIGDTLDSPGAELVAVRPGAAALRQDNFRVITRARTLEPHGRPQSTEGKSGRHRPHHRQATEKLTLEKPAA